MNAAIVYFSGTGNTKAVAEGYRAALEQQGHVAALFSIEERVELPEHELLIIGGPIYAGNMPDTLIQWVRKNVSRVDQPRKAIVFSTSAGLENAHGAKSIGKKLIKKGYALADLVTLEMPRNFYLDKYPPTPLEDQKRQFQVASREVLASVGRLQGGEGLQVKGSVLLTDLMADVFRIMAKSLGKAYHMDETCTACGLCERQCPKQNINHKDKKFGDRCMMCTRCIHGCPVNAIAYKGKKVEPYKVSFKLDWA